ncbi:urea amidolyase [Methylobacterium sp. Leaf102]|uniref:5-oxoprolinase subunit C family protein n=1 Tax=Methylobacterium sp. Leaf102 TaxID=1736253 RepID=UPI0006F62A51|nr:biotin-dependent carboxyltransferase family protein [Methylobacterium sp. Leaf102]KQP33349.1 urea amidolyase [Methylobacterium sp. Leaf102]
MSARLVVEACTGASSFQDGGRRGYQRQGLSGSGPMDRLALAAANALVGNALGIVALELGLGGGRFRLEGGDLWMALAGAPCALRVDGVPVPDHRAFPLSEGSTLAIEVARRGVFAYLACAGGFAVPSILGSAALHQRAGLGGLHGRGLRTGDVIDGENASRGEPGSFGIPGSLDPLPLETDAPVRVVLGPQADRFTPEAVALFTDAAFAVSHRADRMGIHLDGPALAHGPHGYNIVSDATVMGSVQVPGSGRPIVLMADRQTTGGYPKIATVISADLRRVAQRRPGEAIQFRAIPLAEAFALARERAARTAALPGAVRAHAASAGDRLAGANLAGAAVDAFADPLCDGP